MILTHIFSLKKDNRNLQRRIKNLEENDEDSKMFLNPHNSNLNFQPKMSDTMTNFAFNEQVVELASEDSKERQS